MKEISNYSKVTLKNINKKTQKAKHVDNKQNLLPNIQQKLIN